MSPVDHGGLGIPNMERFTRALHLRWLWLAWTDPARPWARLELPCDKDRALFASATTMTVGGGNRALFWHCSWLGEQPVRQDYPNLFRRSTRKNRMMADAIRDDRWIMDLRCGNNLEIIPQVVLLQRRIREANLALHGGTEDKITWKAGGDYTARSAYHSQLPPQPASAMKGLVWKIWAPGNIKFFLWLLHQNRLWCNDCLQRRGWEIPTSASSACEVWSPPPTSSGNTRSLFRLGKLRNHGGLSLPGTR